MTVLPFPRRESTEPRTFTAKETAALVRRALKAAFPAVKFAVRMGRGTASSWLAVSWTDGPTDARVRAAVARFEGRTFNGMTDGYDRNPDDVDAETGERRRYYVDGITTSRTVSPALWAKAAQLVAAYYGVPAPASEAEAMRTPSPAGEPDLGVDIYRALSDRSRYVGSAQGVA